MIPELGLVELVVDRPAAGLTAGTVGTVVAVHTDPPGYEVEFVDDEGRTVALLALAPDHVRPATDADDAAP